MANNEETTGIHPFIRLATINSIQFLPDVDRRILDDLLPAREYNAEKSNDVPWHPVRPIPEDATPAPRTFTLSFKVTAITVGDEVFSTDDPEYEELAAQALIDWFEGKPSAPDPHPCTGCSHYKGVSYGHDTLHCAMYPYGPEEEHCPDKAETPPKSASRFHIDGPEFHIDGPDQSNESQRRYNWRYY